MKKHQTAFNTLLSFGLILTAAQTSASLRGGRILDVGPCWATVKMNGEKESIALRTNSDIVWGLDLCSSGGDMQSNWVRQQWESQKRNPLVQWNSEDTEDFPTDNPSLPGSDVRSARSADLERLEMLRDTVSSEVVWKKTSEKFQLSAQEPQTVTVSKVLPNQDIGFDEDRFCILKVEGKSFEKTGLVLPQKLCLEKQLTSLEGQEIKLALSDLSLIRSHKVLSALKNLDSAFFYKFVENNSLPWLQ